MGEEGPPSLEYIHAKDLFPQKELVKEADTLQVPFPVLQGEWVEYLGYADDAIIAISNYRLHIKLKDSVINKYAGVDSEISVPLRLIDSVEVRDMFQLHINCKDSKVVRCHFATFKQCQDWLMRLSRATAPPARLEDLFAFAYHAWSLGGSSDGKDQHVHLCRPADHVRQRYETEVLRMGFDMQNAWRVSDINSNYKLCRSYPQKLLVPVWITDKELECVASFRSGKRIPVVVYRHQRNGAVIARCSQPEISWWGWRNKEDEYLVTSIARACLLNPGTHSHYSAPCWSQGESHDNSSDFDSSLSAHPAPDARGAPPKLLILDARSYPAAVANRAKGGGCECEEYYPNCEVKFMGMANIHSIRSSFQSLRAVCSQIPDPGSWLSALEGTRWLQHLSVMLKAATVVCSAVEREGRPVLVHCSDGWDRTPQIVSLAKILLDPYYRTLEGFQVLVETEWLDFGHKFGDRCGHQEGTEDTSEQCPVFLQWLDCVHQLLRQFPCLFEFNEAFLVKLVQHTYSCLYGTFLCNNAKEREARNIHKHTCSVWALLRHGNKNFHNFLYISSHDMVLHPICHTWALHLWTAVYLPTSSPCTAAEEDVQLYLSPSAQGDELTSRLLERLPKTRSMDNLVLACENGVTLNRTSSDPNLNKLCPEARLAQEAVSATGGGGGGRQEEATQDTSVDNEGVDTDDQAPPGFPGEEELNDENYNPLMKDCMTTQPLPSSHYSIVHGGSSQTTHLTATGPQAQELGDNPFQGPWPKEAGGECLTPGRPPSPSSVTPVSHDALLMHSREGSLSPAAPLMEDSTETLTEQKPEPWCERRAGLRREGEEEEDEEEAENRGRGERQPLSQSRPNCHWTNHNHPSENGLHWKSRQSMAKPSWNGLGVTEPSRGQHFPQKTVYPSKSPARSSLSPAVRSSIHAALREASCHPAPPSSPQPPAMQPPLEADGLALPVDAVQQRLRQMEAGYRLEVEALRRQVQQLQMRLESKQYSTPPSEPDLDYEDDFTCLHESDDSEKEGSLSDHSRDGLSEGSWDQVEKRNTEVSTPDLLLQVTRWVPDHMASHCFGCDCEFWMAKRRHHCRNCGNVFCKDCCHLKLPVPEQRLYEPVLVCGSCHGLLLESRTRDIRSQQLKKPIAAASS
ncbi:myotubularin-related protein 4-like isoform X2 [Megalops cyprinoides]|uniref:myotubularin-related protein 4-like isoform X2 n=1 Tax=Megalops cyprinoides TaxID=118141 RepID=UPI001864CE50|nr:myotubularin-related protein 4-like isoform X2 [Megalops cyprinoides]